MTKLAYLSGFNNELMSEALDGALPQEQNAPQKPAYGLYAEQLSGSAFTEPRHVTKRTWMYRIRPSVLHGEFQPSDKAQNCLAVDVDAAKIPPTQMRWSPMPLPEKNTDFLDGLMTMAVNGSIANRDGGAIHHFVCNQSMQTSYFYNADAEMMIIIQLGELSIQTECGILTIMPGEVAVIPRGIKMQIHCVSDQARGYVLENFGVPFQLPELGPIGANGLASPRHFLYPVANYEDKVGDYLLINKFQGHFWQAELKHSPFDVVAWHGNYAPYKYDLRLFNTINTVSFDHPDPSIFTVLTSPTSTPGLANIDFAIFPERWVVAEHTFRPPYFHRNVMSEYMGLIYGSYDAKAQDFAPGGASLHNCMSAHGPDATAYQQASSDELKPQKYAGTLAFMWESRLSWQPSHLALNAPFRQTDYLQCWQDLASQFKPK